MFTASASTAWSIRLASPVAIEPGVCKEGIKNMSDEDCGTVVLELAGAPPELFADEQNVHRHVQCLATDAHQHHHDHERRFPVSDDRRLLEKVGLEGVPAPSCLPAA
jgi:hypothetical protein